MENEQKTITLAGYAFVCSPRTADWQQESNDELWVGLYRMPADVYTQDQRVKVAQYLRKMYKPPCGAE